MRARDSGMIPSSADGWHIPVRPRIVAFGIYAPTVVVGSVLTLSFYWSAVGLPILVLAFLGFHSIERAHEVGAIHPAWPMFGLAATEVVFGVAGLSMFGSLASSVVSGVFVCAAATGITCCWLTIATLPYPSPPAPHVPSWEQSHRQAS